MPETDTPTTCVSCGAPLRESATQCDLCGWPVGVEDHDLRERHDDGSLNIDEDASPPGLEEGQKMYCHMCGLQSLPGARFCSSCGTKLNVPEGAPPAKKTAPRRPASRTSNAPAAADNTPLQTTPQHVSGLHVGMLFTAGILIVGALYMITAFSKRAFPPVEENAGQASTQEQAPPQSGLPDEVEQQLAQMQAEADAATGDDRIEKQREMVALLSQNIRPDRAADVQLSIAEATGNAEDWFEAGHLFYTWMDAQNGEMRFAAAQRAADAFEKGLDLGGDDLNIRTALAMAYLNTRSPMLGVQQIRSVLDQDPSHLQGNYYYGVMLTQINRLDQALTQFERVKELAGEDSPFFQQAEMMIQNLRSLRQTPGS